MSKKKTKVTKSKISKKELADHFTHPKPQQIMPENIKVGTVHMRNNGDGTVTMYNSTKKEDVTWSRAEIVAMNMSINAGEHYEALHAE